MCAWLAPRCVLSLTYRTCFLSVLLPRGICLKPTFFFFWHFLNKAQSCLGLPSLLYFPSLPSPPSIIGDLATVSTKPAFSWLSHLLWSGRTLVFMGSLLKPFLSSVHPAGWTRLAPRCGGSRWSSRLFSLTYPSRPTRTVGTSYMGFLEALFPCCLVS